MSTRTLWVCGKHRGHLEDGSTAWDLQGVFDSEAAAVAACASVRDFVGPVPLNKVLPQGATEWPQCRYPLGEVSERIERSIESTDPLDELSAIAKNCLRSHNLKTVVEIRAALADGRLYGIPNLGDESKAEVLQWLQEHMEGSIKYKNMSELAAAFASGELDKKKYKLMITVDEMYLLDITPLPDGINPDSNEADAWFDKNDDEAALLFTGSDNVYEDLLDACIAAGIPAELG